MKIYINDSLTDLPNDFMSVEEILEWKNLSKKSKAIALNNKILKKESWQSTTLTPGDRLTIISGAFGG